ncbi:hypothetical protein [Novosphingobium aquimarinum]|uniref:hypothetical protein n=1 Tax=Novosphingobium aquimarinum TaxID=2682494 RepID=UPI0012EC8129|nr:hypothetical protein [Novosphingobium aquimarinum]
MYEITRTETAHGLVFALRTEGGVSHGALASASLADARLPAALEGFVANASQLARTLRPEHAPDAIRQASGPVMLALGNAIEAEGRAAAEHAATVQRTLIPPASVSRDRASEYRSLHRSLPVGDQMARVKTAGIEELAALLEAPDLAGLAEPVREAVRERALRLFHIERAGTQADHRKQPSLERIIAVGPDVEAAEASAAEGIARLRAEGDRIEEAESSLQGILTMLAIMLDVPREDVLRLAMGA